MKSSIRLVLCPAVFLLVLRASAVAQDLRFAQLDDFKIESCQVIKDCQVGYRTFGKLNDAKSNAILFPTWASGTTGQLQSHIGSGKLVDDSKYFVIAIDALRGGVRRVGAHHSGEAQL